jgi:hypothetical protein
MRISFIKIIFLLTIIIFMTACKIENTVSGSGGFLTEIEPTL